ncbi:hypothetical protein QEN19_002357 [Hanseniaspora menglaensis]
MSSIEQQSLEQIIAPSTRNTARRAHPASKKSFKPAGGKSITFQRRGRNQTFAKPIASGALNVGAGSKAIRIHNLKASKLVNKLGAKSVSSNHKDQIVQQFLKQQASGRHLVSKKVSVSGLPVDVNESSIKEFFNGAVGGVKKVQLAYNQYGKSTGQCTCVFATFEQAAALVENYNGAPIDKGSSKLTIQLIVDANQTSYTRPSSLATRIGIPTASNKQPVVNKAVSIKAVGAKVTPNKKVAPAANKPKKTFAKKRAERPVKKAQPSLEDLDKEMNDYFNKEA